MSLITETQGIINISIADDYLENWLQSFLIDRKAAGVASGTLHFYRTKLKLFSGYCEAQSVKQISQITSTFLRQYLLYLEETGHNPGGRHAAYRTIRTFLLWYEEEIDLQGWVNPIRKVKAPKVPIELIEPVSIETVAKMIKICKKGTFTGDRDTAILLCLLDTGARATEFLDINIEDVNQTCGDILIRQGKGRKPRIVYIGKQSRRALRKYLKHRQDHKPALWVTHPRYDLERIRYDGLRGIILRRSLDANVKAPSLHGFRRAFAISMLRNGIDIFTLAKLMGHEGISVLQRYLKQTNQDAEEAHRRAGPVDHMRL
jgi:integrase/recombinase XerD